MYMGGDNRWATKAQLIGFGRRVLLPLRECVIKNHSLHVPGGWWVVPYRDATSPGGGEVRENGIDRVLYV